MIFSQELQLREIVEDGIHRKNIKMCEVNTNHSIKLLVYNYW